MTVRSTWTCLTNSGRWQILLASLTQTSMKSRTHGLARRNSMLLLIWQKLLKGHVLLSSHLTNWITKIMGLKGIHSPKALKWWTGQSFCPWHGKEGQNKGTVVNHLRTSHYCLGLICGQCLQYFHDQFQHDAPSLTGMSISTHPWWQW